jgi:antitoxin component of MazEF toxin-antitoxin module
MRERPTFDFDHETGASNTAIEETRKLRKTGNSYGVTLSRKAMDVAGFSADTPVTVRAERGQVVIAAQGSAFDSTRSAGRAALEQYRVAFENLAK